MPNENLNAYSRIKPLYDYLQKQADNQRFARSLEIGATFFLITFFMVFAIRPTVFTISSLVGEIKSKEIMDKKMKAKIDDIMRAQDNFASIQERYLIIESSFPVRPNYYQAYSQISSIGQEYQLPLDSISIGLNSATEGVGYSVGGFSVPLSLKLPFDQSVEIISSLMMSRRLMNVDAISFSIVDTDRSPDSSDDLLPGSVTTSFSPTYLYWLSNDEKK